MASEIEPYRRKIEQLYPVERPRRLDVARLHPNLVTTAGSALMIVIGLLLPGTWIGGLFSSTGMFALFIAVAVMITEEPWATLSRRDLLTGGAMTRRLAAMAALEDPKMVEQWRVAVEREGETVVISLSVERGEEIRMVERRCFDPDDQDAVVRSHETLVEWEGRAGEENHRVRSAYVESLERQRRAEDLVRLLDERRS